MNRKHARTKRKQILKRIKENKAEIRRVDRDLKRAEEERDRLTTEIEDLENLNFERTGVSIDIK